MSLEDKFGEAALNYRMATMGGARKAFEELEKAARELFAPTVAPAAVAPSEVVTLPALCANDCLLPAARAAQPYERAALPKGWKLVRVNQHFDALIEALEHAESKGYLPDALKEEWASFACDENVDARAAAPQFGEKATFVPQTFAGFADIHVNETGHPPDEQQAFNAGVCAGIARAAAPQAALTEEQILQTAARFIPAVTEPRVRDYAIVDFARAILATAPTERMSEAEDAARYRWLREGRPGCWSTIMIYSGSALDAAVDAARKAEAQGGEA